MIKVITFNQIADSLNKNKILSARGKIFKGGRVHFMVLKYFIVK